METVTTKIKNNKETKMSARLIAGDQLIVVAGKSYTRPSYIVEIIGTVRGVRGATELLIESGYTPYGQWRNDGTNALMRPLRETC